MTEAASQHSTVLLGPDSSNLEEKPWKGICISRCYSAKTDRKKCKCRCHGEHHGRYLFDKLNEKNIDEFI